MANEPKPDNETKPDDNPPEPKPQDDPPKPNDDGTDWVAEARKWEKRAKDNSDAAARLKELEDAQKSEADKLKERIAELEPTAKEAARLRVALDKGLTAKQARRLSGETEEELSADADDLLEDLGTPKPKVPERPKGPDDGGKPSDTDPPDMSKLADSILGSGL